MSKLTLPSGYRQILSAYETQTAIGAIKKIFEDSLSKALNLKRVSAPLFVEPHTGLNDDLNEYGFSVGEGLYTDMNAVRRDEEMDNLHSIYVDQWDWERVIDEASRNEQTLRDTVCAIVGAICDTAEKINGLYPKLQSSLSRKVAFVTTQQLEDIYPELSPKERENAYTKEHRTVFIMQIGDNLNSGQRHDGRAPDYDDWTLNGDILLWNDVLQCAFEISSMGIRVDRRALTSQLKKSGCEHRRELEFHRALLAGELPLTMGGGIGQSRLCMLLLQKAHIGEVQVSVWDENTVDGCRAAGIHLL